MSATVLILLSIFMPLTAGLVLRAFDKEPNIRDGFSLLVAASTFVCVCSLTPQVMAGERPAFELVEMLPGLSIAFEIEPLGMLFALIASGLWIITTLYAIGYMRGHHEANQTLSPLLCGGDRCRRGAASPQNLLTLFVCYEPAERPDFSAGGSPPERREPQSGEDLPRYFADRLGAVLPASDRLDVAPDGDDGLCRWRILMGKISDGRSRLARAVHLRRRQGGGDAAASLAPGGDGGADAGLGAAPRGGGGQGGRLYRR